MKEKWSDKCPLNKPIIKPDLKIVQMALYKKTKEEQSRNKVIDKLIDYSKSLDW